MRARHPLGEPPVEDLARAGGGGVDEDRVGAVFGHVAVIAALAAKALMTSGTRSATKATSSLDSWPFSWAARRPVW